MKPNLWASAALHREGEINQRLLALVETFGRPHARAGLGLRRLRDNALEFRISRGTRVVFLLFKSNRLQLMMTGSHDEVRAWLRANLQEFSLSGT